MGYIQKNTRDPKVSKRFFLVYGDVILQPILMKFFSSPCQRQSELLPSLGVRRLLTFHILIFSSETP